MIIKNIDQLKQVYIEFQKEIKKDKDFVSIDRKKELVKMKDEIKKTPASMGAEVFMDYTPTGVLIKGYRKFLNWAFQPDEK